jgi:hypothetical protein
MATAAPGTGATIEVAAMPDIGANEAKKTSVVVLVVRQLLFVVMCHLTEVKFMNRPPLKIG